MNREKLSFYSGLQRRFRDAIDLETCRERFLAERPEEAGELPETVFDTVAGVMFAKFMNLFSKKKINPMIGAAGISAFPMSARVIQKMGLKEDPSNHLLMHAIGANVSGQIASAIVGGLIIGLVLA